MKVNHLRRYFAIVVVCVLIIGKILHDQNDWIYTHPVSEKFAEIGKQVSKAEQIISERLKNADEKWKCGLVARKTLESQNVLDPEDPWNSTNSVTIWDFFPANFDCPHQVERVGGSGEGGKWICGLDHLAKKKEPCVVYSFFGVGAKWGFETEVLNRTNCSVYLFDPTEDAVVIQLTESRPERAFYGKFGLSTVDTNYSRTILSTMEMYGHTFIDILRIDAEGAEFGIFQKVKNDFPGGLPFGQVSIEIHLIGKSKDIITTYKPWLTNLENLGLRPFHSERNEIDFKITGIPLCKEYSYINIKYDNYLLHSWA